MTDLPSPPDDDARPSRPSPDAPAPDAPTTSPIPLDEDDIRERAEQDDDDTDSLI